MSLVDKSRSPYFDDYNKDKGFEEILFVPSRSVQVRELNQMQTMFYQQINRFADHVFENGSVVIPGESNYDLQFRYAKVNIVNYTSVVDQLGGSNINLIGSSGITANVKSFAVADGADPATFYVEYVNASDSGTQSVFDPAEELEVFVGANPITTATVISTGVGSKFTIDSGVYYINGRFVLVEQQNILLDKYSNTPSKSVCIEYDEVIKTENDDTTLFDNAQGTTNFTAPGAHRLAINTRLKVFDLALIDTIPSNCVEIFRIDKGQIQKTYRGSDYNVLGDVLAQRTYEESGDYTVKSFGIGFDTYNADQTKFTTLIEPGIAYVRGYRVETSSTTNLISDRARDIGTINNSSVSASIGYYIEVDTLSAIPSVISLQSIEFKDISDDTIGTARIRFISNPSDGVFRLYLFDVKDSTGKKTTNFVSSAETISSNDTVSFTANLLEASIKEASFNSLLFPLNVSFVKTLDMNGNGEDTTYSSVKQLTGTTDTSGKLTFSSGSGEVFVAQDSRFSFGSFTDDNSFVDVASNYVLGGNPTGSVITIDLDLSNASRPVRLNLQVAKQQVVQKIKRVQQLSVTGTFVSNELSLGKADAYEIISVIDSNSNDVTRFCTLNTNKTQSYYGVSTLTSSVAIAGTVTVLFKYFTHSSGDYFGPDSYVDLAYDDIPSENGSRLSDILDFRPRISDSGTNFTGAGSSVGMIPTPFSIIRTDLEHYFKRIDKVYVNSNGIFGVTKGIPAIDPVAPPDPADAMVLYTVYVPPYTFTTCCVQAEKANNRRYTMKDIGNIENRLSNVEYYVTLNLLEQEAESIQVTDPITGANRFKNGFFTDRFIDHGSADFSWGGYHVSVDDDRGELRPDFSLNAIDLEYVSDESSNIAVNDNIVTLPFEQVSFIRQNMRSTTINVNPYAIYRWTGSLKLNPSVDSWIDTNYLDPEVTYNVFNNGQLTQSWNSWQLNWTGGTSVQTRDFTRTSAPHSVWQNANAFGEGVWNRNLFRRTNDTFRTSTVTRTNIDILNDKVLDTSVVPFMRTIDIELNSTGNRPKSRMHFFFDNANINQFVKPIGGTFGSPVFTDEDGKFNAIFRIPNDEANSFRTGEKLVIATDEENNQQGSSTSYAQSTFASTGIRQVRRQTILATRTINTNTSLIRRVWDDPIAQSFLIEQRGGAFVTKINTFFSTKDASVPVAIQIREMENGSPTQRIIPGGEKLLIPSEVSLSTDGSVPTTFQFDYPVYLQDGQEYCFVLMSNSNTYNAFIATMGEEDLETGRFITQQPYAGVMFKSQNNSTWTEDQQSDLQFEIFTAKFDTSVVGELTTHNRELPLIRLIDNAIKTIESSNELIIVRKNHNYVVGSTITVAGATGGNNIPSNQINATHSVIEIVNPNEIKISVAASANATGTIGGGLATITDTIQASILNPNIPVINLPDTSATFFVRGTSGQSIDGSESPYIIQSVYSPVINDTINELDNPLLITNSVDEAAKTSGEKTLKMKTLLYSDNENISPVIDLSGASIITPFTQVTGKQSVEPDASNNWSNYRSRINPLANPADMVKAYLDIKAVNPSNVILSIRVGSSEEEMNDASWVTIPSVSNNTPADGNNFYAYEYEKTGLSEFSFYQIMIQLKSDSATNYPICKRLRVIALSDFS